MAYIWPRSGQISLRISITGGRPLAYRSRRIPYRLRCLTACRGFESHSGRSLLCVTPHLSPHFLSVYCPINKGIKAQKQIFKKKKECQNFHHTFFHRLSDPYLLLFLLLLSICASYFLSPPFYSLLLISFTFFSIPSSSCLSSPSFYQDLFSNSMTIFEYLPCSSLIFFVTCVKTIIYKRYNLIPVDFIFTNL